MFFTSSTFIGIDPTAGEKPFCYAVLDQELRLLALGGGTIEDMLAFTGGQHQAFVAVCAPRQPNTGVMARREVRQSLSPMPASGRWMNFRMADYLLRQHNISIPQTPDSDDSCPQWMRNGFLLFRRLQEQGYALYPSEGAERQALEVYPYAGYAALLGVLPLPKHSLEGRIQRQLMLHEQRINLYDPMRVFEEITRHRLLKSILPLENLLSAGELDALLGAFTAWRAALNPEQVELLGDADEGQIVLPTALKESYA